MGQDDAFRLTTTERTARQRCRRSANQLSKPDLPLALALFAAGSILLVFHRRVAIFWSRAHGDRPVPSGCFYFYLYVLGPIFMVTMGVAALLAWVIARG